MTQCTIVLLSFCVFLLALGTPMPSLLSVLVPNDGPEDASIFEGLSLPTFIYYRQRLTVTPAVQPVFFFKPGSFDSSVFHPPIG
jgi:hypothetical protein